MWSAVKFTLKNTWKSTKYLFLIYLITQLVLSISSIINTFTFKEIIDSANNSKTVLGVSLTTIILIRLFYEIFKLCIEGVAHYTWSHLHAKQMLYYNALFLDKISTLDISKFENPSTVGLISRSFTRVNQFTFYLRGIVEIIAALVELSLSILIFTFASPFIASLIILANLLPIFVRSRLATSSFRLYTADDETKRRYGYTADLITNRNSLPEIKLNHGFTYIKNAFMKLYTAFTNNQLKLDKKYQILNSLSEILPLLSVFIFSIFIASQLTNGQISTGTFVFLFTNVFVFSGALGKLSQNFGFLQQDGPPLYEATTFFDMSPSIIFPSLTDSQSIKLKEQLNNPEICFDHVTFSYPNTNNLVLKDINLKISHGQNLAIVGENGAGKTTLVKLMLRIYDVTKGKITINGIDIKEIPENMLYGVYSTLFQDFGKFFLTVRENLELASGRTLSEEEIISFLKFSNAWDFIKNTKFGINQQLGPEYTTGTDLSGGQWQRLAIARAYAKNSPILILDEPTSSVDAKSEMEIFDRINKELKDKTLIFISHRFSTIKDAKRIIVIDNGQVIEDGSHNDLMNLKGKYCELYTIQAERYSRSI